MSFTKIEEAYGLILDNVQAIQTQLATHFYDALIEQNAYYLGAQGASSAISQTNDKVRALKLTVQDWQKVYQFLLIKGAQTDKLQANHQLTPDSIGLILAYLLDTLTAGDQLDVLEIGSGTGNLAFTLLTASRKQLDYLGIELDDLLIDLSASMAEVMGLPLSLVQEDAVRPQVLKASDVILSDLPIGYYPNDEVARRYQVAATGEHTYAHHLLMEQSLKYLKPEGLAIFLAPTDLLTSPQAPQLKTWLKNHAHILAMISLPETIFGHSDRAKSIFILQKDRGGSVPSFVYPLTNLQDPRSVAAFIDEFQKWKQENGLSL